MQNDCRGLYHFLSHSTYEELCAEKSYQIMPYEIDVMDKNGQPIKRNFYFTGWIGTLQDRSSFKSYIDKTYASLLL